MSRPDAPLIAALERSHIHPLWDRYQRITPLAPRPKDAPMHIVVKAGSPVEVTIRKEGLIPHTFTINAPAAGISVHITLSSEPSTVSFTPKAPGTYRQPPRAGNAR